MRLMSKFTTLGLAALAVAVVAVFRFVPGAGPSPDPPPAPRTVADVIEAADRLGLYSRSDRADGEVDGRLVLSDRPLTWERTGTLRWGDPDHQCWVGTVAVYTRPGSLEYHPLSDHTF